MSFATAIQNTPLLKNSLKNGLQALGSDSHKIKLTDSRKCEGSVDIDTAVQSIYPNDPRWDYALGYDEITHFIEVHPANTSEVQVVLNKLKWLKDQFLAKDAPALDQEEKQFHWITSGGNNHILPNSSQARKLSQSGLKVSKFLSL